MFLLADNRIAVLKVEILYIILMIRGYLLAIQTCLFIIIWLVGVKKAWSRGLKFISGLDNVC
jgi:hypothetical protein